MYRKPPVGLDGLISMPDAIEKYGEVFMHDLSTGVVRSIVSYVVGSDEFGPFIKWEEICQMAWCVIQDSFGARELDESFDSSGFCFYVVEADIMEALR